MTLGSGAPAQFFGVSLCPFLVGNFALFVLLSCDFPLVPGSKFFVEVSPEAIYWGQCSIQVEYCQSDFPIQQSRSSAGFAKHLGNFYDDRCGCP